MTSIELNALSEQFTSLSLNKHGTAVAILEEYLSGKDSRQGIATLQKRKLHGFTTEDMQALMLIYLLHYIEKEDDTYLHRFIECLPYYFSRLNTEKTIHPFTDFELERMIVEKSPQTASFLREQAYALVHGERRNVQDTENELLEMSSLVSSLTKAKAFELLDHFASSFVAWNRIQEPQLDEVIKVFTDLANAFRRNKLLLLTHVCQHERNPDIRAALTVEVARPLRLLERAQKEADVDQEIAYIASLLFGHVTPHTFTFSQSAKESIISLLQILWEKTGKKKYFNLILYIIPYYIQRDANWIEDENDEKYLNKLFTYLLEQGPPLQPFLVADALTCWYRLGEPSVDETVEVIKFYAAAITKGGNSLDAAFHLLQLLAAFADNASDLPHVLYRLRHEGNFDLKKLSTIEQDLFVFILSLPTFSKKRREKIFPILLETDKAIASRIAFRVQLSSITSLFKALDTCEDRPFVATCLKSLMPRLPECREFSKVVDELGKCHMLMITLFDCLTVSMQQPALSIFGKSAKTEHFSEEIRALFLEALVDPAVSFHYSIASLYLLKSTDTKEISTLVSNLLKNKTAGNYFVQRANQPDFDNDLRIACISQLLQEDTPKALLLATRIVEKLLPLSAVKALLKKTVALQQKYPSSEELDSAIQTIMETIWCNDRNEHAKAKS